MLGDGHQLLELRGRVELVLVQGLVGVEGEGVRVAPRQVQQAQALGPARTSLLALSPNTEIPDRPQRTLPIPTQPYNLMSKTPPSVGGGLPWTPPLKRKSATPIQTHTHYPPPLLSKQPEMT